MRRERSKRLVARSLKVIPGGVSSPVRAFKAVGGEPFFASKGDGPYLHDVDGNRYIDYVGSWGPLIVGHAHPWVVEALHQAAQDGTTFGCCTAREVELAERICALMPSIERVRFVNSGTEATMSALRLARAFTGKPGMLKFAGGYHGHADPFLADAGSGLATFGIPASAGVLPSATADTLTVPFNDLAAVEAAMQQAADRLAAVFIEPIPCNIGLVPPVPGFLEGLRALCDKYGILLVFDEVISGFRVAAGGAQALYNVKPDLTTLGKVVGGGLPVGAYGGRADIMEKVAPLGPVYQAGTLSGNPLAMAAGIATLDLCAQPGFYDSLEATAATFEREVNAVLDKHDRPGRLNRIGSIFHLWFKSGATAPPRNFEEIKTADSARYGRFFQALLQEGVYMAPSSFEVGFISSAHSTTQIESTVTAIDQALGVTDRA